MPTIDAQMYAYERNHPGRPWHAVLTGPPEVTSDQMVAAKEAADVDDAILVSPFTMYRYDASYALEVAQAPSRPVRPRQADRSYQSVGDRGHRGLEAHSRRRRRSNRGASIRYCAATKGPRMSLWKFIKLNSGINACAQRYSR